MLLNTMIGKHTILKTFFMFIALFALLRFANCNDDPPYEPADEICEKCNCTSVNGTESNDENGILFTIDCSLKNFEHVFAKWPEQMGENHTGIELIYIMSLSNLNYLQQLPATTAVIFFTCRHCKINEIASGAFIDVPNIVSLDLSWNNIESDKMHADIFRGPYSDNAYEPIKLETLDISHNSISFLEELIFEHTPNIRSLDLSYNALHSLGDTTKVALAKLHKLEVLDLSHTGLMELPGIIFEHMKHLTELFLNGNKFLTVPEDLSVIGGSLQYLHISENPIELIDDASFTGLNKLEQLNMSGMPSLTDIKKSAFKDLTSLELLYVKNNVQLKNFDMSDLKSLPHLKELDVSGNALTVLNFGDADHEESLTNNSTIRPKYQKYFQKLRVLRLARNPWHCECPMMKALSFFDQQAKYFIKTMNNDDARCKTPYDLNAKILYDLPADYVCDNHATHKPPKIQIYEPPQFLRPKSIMLTMFSVVGVVVLGIFIGFAIVCIQRRFKHSDTTSYSSSPIRYTTVRDSTVPTANNLPYAQQ